MNEKEKQLFDLIKNGFEAREIAELLGMKYRTVESQKDKLRLKYGCKNIAHLIYKVMSEEVREAENRSSLRISEIM